jgi:hypothetical protein
VDLTPREIEEVAGVQLYLCNRLADAVSIKVGAIADS